MLNSTKHKLILLINVKMPTIVGILKFISKINTTYESFKARQILIFQHFSYYKHVKFYAQFGWAWRKFKDLGPGLRNVFSYAPYALLS